MPDSGQRRTWALVLGALLLVSLGVAIGSGVTRLTTPSPATSQATSVVPGVGPRLVVAGIPVGYPHTQQGAAQAAGNYLAAFGGQMVLDQARTKAALDQVADPSTRARLAAQLDASAQQDESLWGIQTTAKQGQPVILTLTPIAYRLGYYSTTKATVSVWFVGNIGVTNHQRLNAVFGVSSATVNWLNGDWRLMSMDAGGPAADAIPACFQSPTPTGGIPTTLDGFVPYGGS